MRALPFPLVHPLAGPRSRGHMALGSLAFAILTAASALVSIPLPFSPVPVTLQTLAVTLSGAVLGPFWGAVAQILYVGAGMSGLPVFAGGTGGPLVLVGPTGGYLVGFVFGAWLTGLVVRPGAGWGRLLFGLLAAHAAVFAFGIAHLAVVTSIAPATALRLGFWPFLPGTVWKTVVAALVLRSPRPMAWFRTF